MKNDRDYREIFVERLRGLLAERDMGIADLARESGLPYSTIKQWIGRKNSNTYPRADSLAMICDALSVSMDYLFGRSENL